MGNFGISWNTQTKTHTYIARVQQTCMPLGAEIAGADPACFVGSPGASSNQARLKPADKLDKLSAVYE